MVIAASNIICFVFPRGAELCGYMEALDMGKEQFKLLFVSCMRGRQIGLGERK